MIHCNLFLPTCSGTNPTCQFNSRPYSERSCATLPHRSTEASRVADSTQPRPCREKHGWKMWSPAMETNMVWTKMVVAKHRTDFSIDEYEYNGHLKKRNDYTKDGHALVFPSNTHTKYKHNLWVGIASLRICWHLRKSEPSREHWSTLGWVIADMK